MASETKVRSGISGSESKLRADASESEKKVKATLSVSGTHATMASETKVRPGMSGSESKLRADASESEKKVRATLSVSETKTKTELRPSASELKLNVSEAKKCGFETIVRTICNTSQAKDRAALKISENKVRGGVSGSCIYGKSTVQLVEAGLMPPADKSRAGHLERWHNNSDGFKILHQSHINKGLAYSLKERQLLGIHGLLPPRVMTPDEQVLAAWHYFRDFECDIDRYIYLMKLYDTSEKLLYQLIRTFIEETIPVIYHPTVSQASKQFGLVSVRPRSLYLTLYDAGHVSDVLCNWPHTDVKVVILTDGEKMQGSGDLGVLGAGIPISKSILYSALAGIPSQQILPITIDVGTDNQELLDDAHYVGLKHKRIQDGRYDKLIQEVFDSVVYKFGWSTVIQTEGLGSNNTFHLLDQNRSKYSHFNDNVQGTASAVVAGILAALRCKDAPLIHEKFLFMGAGEAAIGIANLLTVAMIEMYVPESTAKEKIWLFDSKGLIVKNRPAGGLTMNKVRWAHQHPPIHDLETAVTQLKPTVLIGVSGQSGEFTPNILKLMSQNTAKPVIFCLSTPALYAEATAEEVYTTLKSKVIYVGGCYYPTFQLPHKTLHTSQVSSLYVVPAITLMAIACQVRTITEGVFLKAAQILARLVTDNHLDQGRVYPPIEQLSEINTVLAVKLCEYAYQNKLANFYPEPKDKNFFIRSHQLNQEFSPLLPAEYDWPSTES